MKPLVDTWRFNVGLVEFNPSLSFLDYPSFVKTNLFQQKILVLVIVQLDGTFMTEERLI